MKPSDLVGIFPFASIMQKSECETIAKNIIVIQSRIDNKFQLIDWDTYYVHRRKDGEFSDGEKKFYEMVAHLLTTEELVRKFSKYWNLKDK